MRVLLASLSAEVGQKCASLDAEGAVATALADLAADGPLWTRVHGKTLAGRISARFDGAAIKGGLTVATCRLLERQPELLPAALLADLRLALATFAAAPA